MSVLERNALGRVYSLGSLYDARSDSFTGESILKTNSILSDSAIVVETDTTFSNIFQSVSRNLHDRFDQFDIKGELRLSILCGLVDVKGSAKYLTEESKNERQLCSSLLYNTRTKLQKLDWTNEKNILQYLNLDVMSDPGYATHFVSGIQWGYNITISSNSKFNNKQCENHVEANYNAEVGKLKIISGDGSFDLNTLEKLKANSNETFDFRIHGDIKFPTDLTMPGTFEEAIGFMAKAPSLLQETNDGKGVPVLYILQPLCSAQKLYKIQSNIDNVYKAITDQAVTQCLQIFKDYTKVKQKIEEAEKELEEKIKFVGPQILNTVRDLKSNINLGEAAYKLELMEQLSLVRSGEQDPSSLQSFLLQFRQDHENDAPKIIADSLTVFDTFREKIALVETFQSEGVIYIGSGESLGLTIRKERSRKHIYVLNYFEAVEEDKQSALECFQTLQQRKKNEKDSLFLFADREINLDKSSSKKSEITITLYVMGKVATENLIPDLLKEVETNLAYCEPKYIKWTSERTCEMVTAKLPCPGFSTWRRCSPDPRTFKCHKCREKLNYDYKNYKLLCKCGQFLPEETQFKCTDKCHGADYERFPSNILKSLLEKLRPKDYNILILGETGVGKSTWINGMRNYAAYPKLEDALRDPPTKYCIPQTFTISDPKKNISKAVYLGDPDPNESYTKGESATQEPRTYSFVMDEAIIRLIDTPGIGDTRGIEKDKENIDNVLGYLEQFNRIHGITILLKPNNSRLNLLFSFCLKELLRHLHKDAVKNIMFVFTNARGTFYKPGDTYDALQALLQANPGIGIELSHDNIFCMDNEPVRFLAACNSGVEFSKEETENFSKSWDISYKETSRLINRIRFLLPHATKQTVTLNKVRRQISGLARPLALITENINHNVQACLEQTRLIEEREKKKRGLEEVLFVPVIELKQVPLSYPQTVCTSSKCIDVRVLHGQEVNHYKTVCHDRCYLIGVSKNEFPEPRLKLCRVINPSIIRRAISHVFPLNLEKFCQNCGCHWKAHMHITYAHESVEKKGKNRAAECSIFAEEKRIQEAEKIKQELIERVQEYRTEEKVLLEASAQFGSFLKHNSILRYNDTLKEYLEHMKNEESQKVGNAGVKNFEGLQRLLKGYEEEVKNLDAAMKLGTKKPKFPDEIQNLINYICTLKHFGPKVKEGLDASTAGGLIELKNTEVSVRIEPSKKRSGLLQTATGYAGKMVIRGVKSFLNANTHFAHS